MSKHLVVTEAELETYAQALAQELSPGSVIYLSGELGAGKTTFTRSLLEALGTTEPVSSPTFTLLNQHPLPTGRAVHADLYRLVAPEDVYSLGLLEEIANPEVTVIVEWPERASETLPPPTRHLHLSHHTPTTRVITELER